MGMEDVLRIDKILDFCDVPQLFVARDAFDTLYLCLLYDDETVYRYTGIRISTRRLESFLAGKADLRLLYLQPENEHEYYDVVFQSGEYQKTLLKEVYCWKINCRLRDMFYLERSARMWSLICQ